MPRYVCIHGHFYQPPRENPWLDFVEKQESASPWHDWNERVTAECYRRNTASRILNGQGEIRKICNNYSRMSFNIGPTLLSWMENNASRCYQAILKADALGAARFSGHGPAMAQVYNHIIMPLANRRDKITQVKWGIEDFKHRFGRVPEGMWLAETAVDTETLEVLADNGILFTVLAPKQASEVQDTPGGAWRDVKWEKVDSGKPYRCDLPSGKSIALFFYDGALAQAVAFGGMLDDGGYFAKRMIEARQLNDADAVLSHIATDGESYGHHHDHGDMALAYCLETIDLGHEAELTVYGEFLAKYPPAAAVRIVENSSWSCAHGVERWRSDCGCSNGTPGFNQKWRAPLRATLDWLRDKIAAIFEHEAAKYLADPWASRDDYIRVVLDRSERVISDWLAGNAQKDINVTERVRILKLMEAQRAAMLMYTSCGWFFDEISGIETVQILRYAAYAISLIRDLTGLDYEHEFIRRLEKAPSNVKEFGNGGRVYELMVLPSKISFERIAAHYGMLSLFPDRIAGQGQRCLATSGKLLSSSYDATQNSKAFTAGVVDVTSKLTTEQESFFFAANYFGDTSVVCGVKPCKIGEALPSSSELDALREHFISSDDEGLVKEFGHNIFSLRHILADEQRALLSRLVQRDLVRIEDSLHSIVRDYDKLVEYFTNLGIKAPFIFRSAASIVSTADVVNNLEGDVPDIGTIRELIEKSLKLDTPLDNERIGFALSSWLMAQMHRVAESPTNSATMERICSVLSLFMDDFKWHLSLYEAQNLYFAAWTLYRKDLLQAGSQLKNSFIKLGKCLKFSPEALN